MKDAVDENRFEQELIYYIEKLDISEEKVRLANHCSYFLETMEDKGPAGKEAGIYLPGNGQGDQYPGL